MVRFPSGVAGALLLDLVRLQEAPPISVILPNVGHYFCKFG